MFGTRSISITGIRFCIEFSSILVLAFLCIMHEFTDVTFAKQFNIDHASNQANFEDIEHTPFETLSPDDRPFVKFTPESLDFGHHPIGMPVVETVYVHNNHDEINIQMISISGNTQHFHPAFFEDKILAPQSNTSFQVVFLARQEGLVNNTLYIHSSAGSFPYRVSAYGEVSPFRVRPLIGARVPLNSSFASLIYIYNPLPTPLQLTEMYTSGGGLHLELPDDELEAPSHLWKVPPFETRPVMKAFFVGRTASNHTSYIRIRTNASEAQFMLPVEVEVSSSPGLYSPHGTLDFGILRAKHDPPKTLPIEVINAAAKVISVQSIVVTPIFTGLSVDFSGPVKLTSKSSVSFHIGNLILDPSQFSCTGFCSGKVLIKSKNNQYKLAVPFTVRIIQGELKFNSSQLHFFINESSNYSEQRALKLTNNFDTPIIVHDINLPDDAKPYFRFHAETPYSLPIILPIASEVPMLGLEFTPTPQLNHFSTVFRLLTNLSYFDLPLYAYRGRLDLFIPNSSDQSKLDIGVVGLNGHKSTTLVLANHNPIAIRLIYWQSNLTGVSVELVGTSQGNVTSEGLRSETYGFSGGSSPAPIGPSRQATLLQPDHFAVFRVHVNKLPSEGHFYGRVTITTAFETIDVPLSIKVLRGSLTADKVIMPKTYPGKIVKSYLSINSNYTSHIKIKGAFIEPKDERFKLKLLDQLIKPGHDNQVQIMFDASAACFQKLCYSALDIEKEVGHLWLLGSGLYSDTAYIDKELYKLLRNQWLMLSDLDRNPIVNVRLQVDGFGSFNTAVQAQQQWPRLANKLVIRFPSIRVGQRVTKDLMVENTADRPVLVQAINIIDYPNSDVLLQLISSSTFHQQWAKSDIHAIRTSYQNRFNTSAFMLANNTNQQGSRIQHWLGVQPNANSQIMFLPPGARHRLAVTFYPLDERNYTSLLILRNNLTIIDVVMLRGEGGRGLLKIGKSLPNSLNSKLLLEFPERSLERKCRNLASKPAVKSNFNALVIKEKFKATNIGRMELQIRSFLIDGVPCEGYGFRISRCEPILLAPNQTFDLEVTYSPDFTQTSITHELKIVVDDDSSAEQKFMLAASVPARLLAPCLAALPRPIWEDFIYYLLVFMAFFVLLLSTVVGIFDAHRITFNYFSLKQIDCNGKFDTSEVPEANKLEANSGDSVKKANGSLCNGQGNLVNGKVNSQQVNTNKVRNRRGKQNHASNNNTNSRAHSTNHVKPINQKSNIDSGPKSDETGKTNKNDLTDSKPSENMDQSINWSYVMRKKCVLFRQDSSSSEHSQRSSDNNLPSGSFKTIDKENEANQKKSSCDSLNDANHAPSTGNRKTKAKEQEKRAVENLKNINLKKSMVAKLTSRTQKSSNEKLKLVEKASSTDVSKSSSESLNNLPKTCDIEIQTKVRAATLPLTTELNKASLASGENVSASQSNISSFYAHEESNKSEVYLDPMSSNKPGLCKEVNRTNKWTAGGDSGQRSMGKAREVPSYPPLPSSRDIWEMPITNFDSEMAMNLLVRQTEEFAANDDRMPLGKLSSNRKHTGSTECSHGVTRLSEDKWEIGEWRNDMCNPPLSRTSGQFVNRQGLYGSKGHSGNVLASKNLDGFPGDSEYSRGFKTMGQARKDFTVSDSSFTSTQPMSNSSLSSNSATFSPVIGRPTSTSQTLGNSCISQVGCGTGSSSSQLTPFNEFDLNLEKSLTRAPNLSFDTFKSSLFDLNDFNNCLMSNNLDELASSKGAPSPPGAERRKMNSPLDLDWNRNSFEPFTTADSFFSTSTSTISKPETSSVLNFENDSIWTSVSPWPQTADKSLFPSFSGQNNDFSTDLTLSNNPPSLNWPTPSTGTTFPSGSNQISGYQSAESSRVWSPFDFEAYDNSRESSLLSGQANKTMASNSNASALTINENPFDNAFNMLGAKAAWTPLRSNSSETPPASLGLSALPNEVGLYGRFSQNPSPSSSTGSSSTNQESKIN